MPNAVTGNAYLKRLLNSSRAYLNIARSLRLFSNEITITPATAPSEFVEAWFPGYTRKSTAGIFGTAYKVIDGLYECDSTPQVWTPTDDSDVTVRGWFITTGSDLLLAAALPEAITVVSGIPISVVIQLQEASLSRC